MNVTHLRIFSEAHVRGTLVVAGNAMATAQPATRNFS